jgi:exopolysaccharide biosynthesis polyprenyl glycosylphosphotransferase
MTLTLAIFEGAFLFAAVCGAIFIWASPLLTHWTEIVVILARALAISLCGVVSLYYNDLYNGRIVRSFGGFASRLLQTLGVAFVLLAALYSLLPATNISNEEFILSLIFIVPTLLGVRALTYTVMRRRPFLERVLILGASPLAHKIVREIERCPDLRYTIVGVAADAIDGNGSPFEYPLLGPLERLDKIIQEVRPDRLIVALAERRARLPVSQLLEARLTGRLVEEGVSAYERFTGKLAIESLTPSDLIFSSDFKKSRLDLAAGRLLSFTMSIVGLVVLAPLLGLIALLIKLDSRGPVFFVQDRVGMCAKRFKVIKFRTMHLADVQRSEWACDNAERITRIGKWLRKFRLDELPQFFNVIRGDMNFVGPRPHPVSNLELFVDKIPYYSLRSVVRPGITGWAQVRFGYANNLDEEIEKMRYDLYYIKHQSIWFDLRILCDTVKIVFFGRGSECADACGAGPAMVTNHDHGAKRDLETHHAPSPGIRL